MAWLELGAHLRTNQKWLVQGQVILQKSTPKPESEEVDPRKVLGGAEGVALTHTYVQHMYTHIHIKHASYRCTHTCIPHNLIYTEEMAYVHLFAFQSHSAAMFTCVIATSTDKGHVSFLVFVRCLCGQHCDLSVFSLDKK